MLASTVVRWGTLLGTARRNEGKDRGQDQLLEGRQTLSRLVDRIEIGKISVEGLIFLSGYGVKTLSDSVLDTLHLNTSIVSDSAVDSNP